MTHDASADDVPCHPHPVTIVEVFHEAYQLGGGCTKLLIPLLVATVISNTVVRAVETSKQNKLAL